MPVLRTAQPWQTMGISKPDAFQPESKPSTRGSHAHVHPHRRQSTGPRDGRHSRHEPRAVPLTAQDGHRCGTAGATPVLLTRESRSGTYRLLDAGLHLLAQQAFEDEGVAELLSLWGKGQDPGRAVTMRATRATSRVQYTEVSPDFPGETEMACSTWLPTRR